MTTQGPKDHHLIHFLGERWLFGHDNDVLTLKVSQNSPCNQVQVLAHGNNFMGLAFSSFIYSFPCNYAESLLREMRDFFFRMFRRTIFFEKSKAFFFSSFLLGKLAIFCCLFANSENNLKNTFQCLIHMTKITTHARIYIYIYSYYLESYGEEKGDEKKLWKK